MMLRTKFPKNDFSSEAQEAKNTLFQKSGVGSEMTDWLEWPKNFYGSQEYRNLKIAAEIIRSMDDAVLVIGIGGSYLGARAVIESEYGAFYNEIPKKKRCPKIYFVGNELSPEGIRDIGKMIENQDFSIIYISKSGGTIEPALSFRYFYEMLVKKYGKEQADARVVAITGEKGILHSLAVKNEWTTFSIPEGIGGRYSVLTPVGLFPIAIAGINTDALLEGAIEATSESCVENAQRYAAYRMSEYSKGHCVEFLAVNNMKLQYFGEWYKQLFGESEGKDSKGIFPTSGIFPTDLHSIGQYLQEGSKGLIFETQVIREFKKNTLISSGDSDDGLDKYLGKSFNDASNAAMEGSAIAHEEGGMSVGKIYVGSSTQAFGYLLQFMMTACGISAYMLGVNPFDQPGVEQHKVAMKKILGK